MHNLWIPEGVCNTIDSSIRQFVWGGKNCHWVKWNKIAHPRLRGGLGLRKARPMNIAMLGKHVWEIIHHPDKLWVRVLTAKYLLDSHIFQPQVRAGVSYTWQSILKAATTLAMGFIYRVGRGNISLWYERWLHKGRLCDRVPFVDIQDTHLQIHDICKLGSWNFEQLATTPPPPP